jgi:hypothetical protein
LVAAVVLFFALDIPGAVGILSGRRSARGVADLRAASGEGRVPGTGRQGRALGTARQGRSRRQPPEMLGAGAAASGAVAAPLPSAPAAPWPSAPAALVATSALAATAPPAAGTTVMGDFSVPAPPGHPAPPGPSGGTTVMGAERVDPGAGGTSVMAPEMWPAAPAGAAVRMPRHALVSAGPAPRGTTIMGEPAQPAPGAGDDQLSFLGGDGSPPASDTGSQTQVVASFRFTSAKESL